jgi:hypothetical protein
VTGRGGGVREGQGEVAGVEHRHVDSDAERWHEVGGVAEQRDRRVVVPGVRDRQREDRAIDVGSVVVGDELLHAR